MKVVQWLKSGGMRKPDAETPEFHLFEELAAPKASVLGHRVAVWVYSQGGSAREIVICGHAESSTCARVSAAVFDALQHLSAGSEWMLSAGAGYIRLPDRLTEDGEKALAAMLDQFEAIARLSGLVDIEDGQLEALDRYRAVLASRPRTSTLCLPEILPNEHVAAFLPIVPDGAPSARPFSFRLRGWHYDCPEFQNVADQHLRALRRAFVEDALRRRSTYRMWLQEWMGEWIDRLHRLPEEEASVVRLQLPPVESDASRPPAACSVDSFLAQHAGRFAAPAATWPDEMRWRHRGPYFPKSDAELDAPRSRSRITLVDFERCTREERDTRPSDEETSERKDTTENMPALISRCLVWLGRMNKLIEPYEKIAERRRVDQEPDLLNVISRNMLIDTMIRGWPPFYLEHEEDRAAFAAWSKRCRAEVWKILLRTASIAGVDAQIFVEDSVVYQARFEDDLGCTVTPLMLFDNKEHAVVQSSRAGATAAVPLWPRRGKSLLAKAADVSNREMAERLVGVACNLADSGAPAFKVAEPLRAALAWNAIVAGQRIFDEWLDRLGDWKPAERRRAVLLLESAELLAIGNTTGARERCSILTSDPEPVPEALVLSALAEAMERGGAGERYRRLAADRDERRNVTWLDAVELEELEESLRGLHNARSHEARVVIEKALDDPSSVCETHPDVARAAEETPDALRAVIGSSGQPPLQFKAAAQRYASYWPTTRARALLQAFLRLNELSYQMERTPGTEAPDVPAALMELSRSMWLPPTVQPAIDGIRNEFLKRGIDFLLSRSLQAGLAEAANGCLSAAAELLRYEPEGPAPLEAVVLPIHVDLTFDHAFRRAFDRMLAVEVPQPRWQRWRNAMGQLRDELICVLSNFSGPVSLVPDCAPMLSDAGLKAVELLDSVQPRDAPMADPEWQNLGPWARLVGKAPARLHGWDAPVSR